MCCYLAIYESEAAHAQLSQAEAIFMLLPDTEVSGRLKHTDEGGNR